MPFAPAANPDLAGQFMYAGISQAGAGIAQGASEVIEGLQKKTKDRKAYLGMGEAMVRSGELTPEEWEAAKNHDTDSLMGLLDGRKVAAVLKHLKLTNQLSELNLGQRQKTAAGQTQFNQALSARLTPPQGPTQDGAPLPRTPIASDEMLEMASRSGAIDPTMLRDLLKEQAERETQFFQPGAVGRAHPITTPEGRALPGLYVTPTGPRQSQVVADVGGAPLTQNVSDAAGGQETILYNPRTGAPTVLHSGAAQARRADAATIAQLETALQNLDIEMNVQNGIAAKAKAGETNPGTKKPYVAPPPEKIKDLERRRAGISKLLDEAYAEPGAATKAADPNERVKVIGPDGKPYTLPHRQLQEALTQGYKLAP